MHSVDYYTAKHKSLRHLILFTTFKLLRIYRYALFKLKVLLHYGNAFKCKIGNKKQLNVNNLR